MRIIAILNMVASCFLLFSKNPEYILLVAILTCNMQIGIMFYKLGKENDMDQDHDIAFFISNIFMQIIVYIKISWI